MPIERHFDYYNSAKYLSEFLFSYQKFATTLTIFPYLVVIRRVVIISAKNILEPLFLQRHFGTMLRFTNKIKLILTILSILSLSSCGGGGGDGDSSPQSRENGTISGNVYDAPVSGATVSAYEYVNGALGRKLGQAVTSATGDYSIQVASASMPVYVVAEGGGYQDPISGQVVRLSDNEPIKMASVVNYGEGNDQEVMITPLSYMVTGLTEYKIKSGTSVSNAINEALNTINSMYGFNVNSVEPIDITSGGHDIAARDGHKYGAVLTAYSSYAYDALQEDSTGTSVYTSINLSKIGYRDISADGYLNGRELSEDGLFLQDINFGTVKVTSELYTNDMAEHLLIVVSDPQLNVSGTPVSEYTAMADSLNGKGTNGSAEGPIPSRDPVDIDDKAPEVSRDGNSTLKATDFIEIVVKDDVGVKSAPVVLKHSKSANEWQDDITCEKDNTSAICWVDETDFVEGPRETRLKVYVDTTQLDPESESDVADAYFLVKPKDVLGKENSDGIRIDFEWDNTSPVIEVTSAETINSQESTYVLAGVVKEHPDNLVDSAAYVSLSGGEAIKNTCSRLISGSNIWCKFETDGYETKDFGDSANFTISAEDVNGNVSTEQFTLYNDDTVPNMTLSYPVEFPFNYEDIDGNSYTASFSDTTYTADNVDNNDAYLKVDYDYVADGLLETINSQVDPDKKISFTAFNPETLSSNSIPYVIVNVLDPNSSDSYGSSADNLKLKVEYWRKKSTDTEDSSYILYNTAEVIASDEKDNENYDGIPFAKIEYDSDGTRAAEMTYYVPLIKEVLDVAFSNATKDHSQKLVISASDPSKNTSNVEVVYFKTTFDKPEATIVTPFIGATVRLEGLVSEGGFNYLGTCRTEKSINENDLAGCSITYESKNYDFFKISLQSDGGTHYFQWSKDQSKLTDFSAEGITIGSYFTQAENATYYLTELSVYQTALFDSQWDQLDSDSKTPENAASILEQVNNAIASGSNPLLGFDPIETQYATNAMLDSGIPQPPSDEYKYRFLLDALSDMASSSSSVASVDYAIAFYKDLSSDGMADGKGQNGESIYIGSEKLEASTYRSKLANSYYTVATNNGVDSSVALSQADVFATANPSLGEKDIFESAGSSIDTQAPSVVIAPNSEQSEGSFTQGASDAVFNIAGKVHASLTVEDIAGINSNASVFTVYSYDQSGTQNNANVSFSLKEGGDAYTKVYEFAIDSLEASYSDVVRFEIVATVADVLTNSKGPFVAATFYVDNNQPQGEVIDTGSITHGEKFSIRLSFDEPVTNVEATVGGDNTIIFDQQGTYSQTWTGETTNTVDLIANQVIKNLKVTGSYYDALNNTGNEFSSDVSVIPVIEISDVTDNNIVNAQEDDVSQVVFSGTSKGLSEGTKLNVVVTSEKRSEDKFDLASENITVDDEGNWVVIPQTMKNWEESQFSIAVTGSNGVNEITETKTSSYIDRIKPDVTGYEVISAGESDENKNILFDGKAATVTLTFSERVEQPNATINGEELTLTADDSPSNIWSGVTAELNLPSDSSISQLVVTEYNDTASEANFGDEHSEEILLKPVVAIDPINPFNSDSDLAKSFVISGTSKGIQNGAKLTIKVYLKDELKYQHEDVQVTNGVWTLESKDISSWESGEIRITVNGENDKKLAAEEASLAIAFTDDIQPSVQSVVLSPEKPADGEEVTVTVTF
ncbi:hypothetical protein HRJ45_20730, partial [Vibrio coralliilyticus]|nr:hypothetical protein [Vibrio coralliilyticus]NRF81540.1 hypothetical protein [Vibrio coralliilyticus]